MFQAPGDDDLLLEELAQHLSRRGLREPAAFAIEAGRPLVPLLGQLLWIAQPAFSILWPSERIGRLARLLERPGAGERLLARLDAEKINGQR